MTKINKETDDSKDYENVLYDGKQPQVIFIFFFSDSNLNISIHVFLLMFLKAYHGLSLVLIKMYKKTTMKII